MLLDENSGVSTSGEPEPTSEEEYNLLLAGINEERVTESEEEREKYMNMTPDEWWKEREAVQGDSKNN